MWMGGKVGWVGGRRTAHRTSGHAARRAPPGCLPPPPPAPRCGSHGRHLRRGNVAGKAPAEAVAARHVAPVGGCLPLIHGQLKLHAPQPAALHDCVQWG